MLPQYNFSKSLVLNEYLLNLTRQLEKLPNPYLKDVEKPIFIIFCEFIFVC